MKKLLKILALAASAVLAEPVFGQPITTRQMVFMVNTCITVDSTMPVEIGAASSMYPTPCKSIVLTPQMLDAPPPVLFFVLIHESQHLNLNHKPTLAISEEESRFQEAQADCSAAKIFAQNWPELVHYLRMELPNFITSAPTHGSKDQRMARINTCLGPE